MSHKPSSVGGGVRGTLVSAATVATTKYTVGTAVENKFGDRYMKIVVKSTRAYDLYVFGSNTASFSSTANDGAGAGVLLYSATGQPINGTATTGVDGKVFFAPIATYRWILPVVYQAAGADATITVTYQSFND